MQFYPPKGEWTPFASEEDQLEHFRLWGLISPKSKSIRSIVYAAPGVTAPMPCKVVGYQQPFWAIVQVGEHLTGIHGDYLAETQPDLPIKLLGGFRAPDLLQDYVVLDIETTGFVKETDHILEIAAVRYTFGTPKETFHTMVNPGCSIPKDIAELTGITDADVADAPCIDSIAESLLKFLGDSPIVGHNALSFDVPFLSYHLRSELTNAVVDTLPVARRVFPGLPSYKLQMLNTALELGATTAHRALADVETTNALLLACMVPGRYTERVNRAAEANPAPPKKKKAEEKPTVSQIPKFKKYSTDYKSIHATASVDTNSPLYGKVIVFTGDLRIPREEAMQMAVNAGAELKGGISRKVDYLVVGTQDKTIVGAGGMSGKEEKAHALNASGKASIQLISEDQFLELAGACHT